MQRIVYLIVGMGLFLSSCNQAQVQVTPTFIPTGMLMPYYSVTPSPKLPTATIRVTIPVTPAPTPTPFLYTVKNSDTMLGIAYQFGISLEDLQAANPKVVPHFMSVGMQLIIPIGGEIPEVLPTPTPMPVHAEQPRCFPSGDGGAWCIVALKNENETNLENLSVWIGLYNLRGENFASQVAYAPLNILRPGSTIPLMAYFSPPLLADFQTQSEVLSGLAVAANDTRYLDLQVKVGTLEINQDGKQAVISGEVVLPENAQNPSQLWALAVAYDSNGDIVGVRKWKSAGETSFDITVYSVAGMIDHVEVLTEGRP